MFKTLRVRLGLHFDTLCTLKRVMMDDPWCCLYLCNHSSSNWTYSVVRVSYKVKILLYGYTITEPQLFSDSQCRGLLRCKSSDSGRAEAFEGQLITPSSVRTVAHYI